MDISPTQTHPLLIFVIFLALWSTVVGKTVSSLMVCMTGCHGLRWLPAASAYARLSLVSLALLYLALPYFSSLLVCLPFLLSPLSNPAETTIQPGPSCAARYTYCPAGIHCSQLVPRHVLDSVRTCLCVFAGGVHMCVRVQICTCVWTTTMIILRILSAENHTAWERHESEQAQLLGTIHQYAERDLEQAQQKNTAKSKSRKNLVLTRRERKICLYNPPASACQLSAGCW